VTAPNPLVAERQDSTRLWSGITLVEGIVDLKNGINSGSWVSTTIGSAFVAVDAALLVVDPLGSLLSWAVAGIIEHVKPLSDALDWLAGDPDQVAANAQTWANIAQHTTRAADELRESVWREIPGWAGPAADAYRAAVERELVALQGFAESAAAKSSAIALSGNIVLVVRTTIRDLIADLASVLILRIPEWTAEAGLTLGLASPLVIAQVSALAAKWSLKISQLLYDLLDSLRRLLAFVRQVDDYTAALKTRPRGTHYNPADPHSTHVRDLDGDERPNGIDPDADGNGIVDDLDGDGLPDIPPLRSGGPPQSTTTIDPDFLGENIAENTDDIFGIPTNGVQYLTREQRETFRVFVRDGRIYSALDGELIDTTTDLTNPDRKAIFVMDDQGNFYLSPEQRVGIFHHSSFFSGGSVSGAGEIAIKDGQIIAVNRHSGHYKPSDELERQVLDQLEAQGIDMSQVRKDLM
jgi:hypothetical protein